MAILRIVYYPDAPLNDVAQSVDTFDEALETLVRNMFETMHAYEGVGLAAPQIGISQRIFVMQEPDGEELCLINPELSDFEGSEEGEEGCLSMPQVYAEVRRARKIRVSAHDQYGAAIEFDAEDFPARIIQHETDHLNGILFPQRLDIITRQSKLDEWREVREKLLSETPSK